MTAQATGSYGPGIQSWYNEWVQPDPVLQSGGVPTRVLFGLEEVWENDDTSQPQDGHSSFHVIGRYFGGSTCVFLDPTSLGIPYACPTNRGDPVTITTSYRFKFIPLLKVSLTLSAAQTQRYESSSAPSYSSASDITTVGGVGACP